MRWAIGIICLLSEGVAKRAAQWAIEPDDSPVVARFQIKVRSLLFSFLPAVQMIVNYSSSPRRRLKILHFEPLSVS